jgi:sporulation protein YlmC with PRC-barrel domain
MERNGIFHVLQWTPGCGSSLIGGRDRPESLRSSTIHLPREKTMLKFVLTATAAGLLSISAYAAQDSNFPSARLQTAIPQHAMTVTDWYKQNVYDPNNSKIGEIMDVLVDQTGKINTLIVGVGGFLGAGEKDVAVPFEEVHATMNDNNKMYLVMNTTKDNLKSAPGFKYDSTTTTWVPDNK